MKLFKNLINNFLKKIGDEAGNRRREQVLAVLPHRSKSAYLDCGCGDGEFTLQMANKIGTKNIYGIEIIDSEIKKAKKNGIKVNKVDLDSIFPYPDNKFSVITAIQVIEHLFEVDNFVSEIYRILKPGGIVVISTENLASLHNIAALLIGLQPSTGPYISQKYSIGFHPLNKVHVIAHEKNEYLKVMRGHTRVMAYRSFIQLFKTYGFKVVDQKTAGYYPFPSFIANPLADLDKWHALDVILKLQK